MTERQWHRLKAAVALTATAVVLIAIVVIAVILGGGPAEGRAQTTTTPAFEMQIMETLSKFLGNVKRKPDEVDKFCIKLKGFIEKAKRKKFDSDQIRGLPDKYQFYCIERAQRTIGRLGHTPSRPVFVYALEFFLTF